MLPENRIACWMSDKKLCKFKWNEFKQYFEQYGYNVFLLDLNSNIESQGPFSVFLHKMTDFIALEKQGDFKSAAIMHTIENYLSNHPEIVIIDPFSSIRQLLSRYTAYSIINNSSLHKYGIFTPNFCEITSDDRDKMKQELEMAGVTFPFICKPMLGHGSKEAHRMAIIFNKNNIKDCKPPCVAQSFVNHNAVLYKIFIVGEKHHFVQRPSLKNFYADENQQTIFFESSDVSKAGAQSSLCILDSEEKMICPVLLDPSVLHKIACTLRKAFKMELLGADVVIDNNSGKYGIIDVNAFPGYDGFPHFIESLFECVHNKLKAKITHNGHISLDLKNNEHSM
ncbi:inositol-tetrakisphosphate 1-kinase [Agrilus planipennis]|uniref:Inositol-tetrakisphosphate 1-kinase n=1 Tax=Agrilus planipennis TaxID=224129 RepID=A0A1W4W6D3_AGRPL|nr:inositol-tetrakisphosphate 1-kinase [Agrilus planipennis]